MKRWFVLLAMVMLICMSMTNFTLAESMGDEYELNPEGWPDRHWKYMTNEEIAQYEAKGWQRYTGELWYNADGKYAPEIDTLEEIKVSDIETYYNQGYTCHIIYHWLLDGRLIGKHQEQSVYVGRYIFSCEQAEEYLKNDRISPNLVTNVQYLPEYYSLWCYAGKECGEPLDSELDDSNYTFERIAYNAYDYGGGSKLLLRSGDVVSFTLKEVLELGSVDYEMIHWE